MRLEAFFEKFELFADAPNAVGKMRELVLELAIQGKLVSQDSADEPALSALERIAAKKVKVGRVVRVKAGRTGTAAAEESAAHVPIGWGKASLAELVTVLNGRAYAKDELLSSGTPVLRVGNLFTSKHWYYSDLALEADKYCEKGDLIFAWSASFGPFIWPGPKVIYHYHIWKLELHSEADLNKHYLYWFLQNKTQEIKRAGHGVSMLHMTKEKMEKLEVMVPPLAEQKRIVAKVDELMALCDRLETQQQERDNRHAALARASLTRFAEAPTPANLDFLFHKSYPITPAELRRAILALAVQGQLVGSPKDSSSWSVVRMRDVCIQITDGEHATPQRTSDGVPLATAKNVRDGFLDLSNTDWVAPATAEKCWKRCKPRHDDLLMVCVGATTGRVCLVQDPPDMVLVRSVALIRPNQERISPTYLNLFLRSPGGQSQIWSNVKQSAQPCLYLGKMSEFEIVLPPLAEQRRIVAKVDQLMTLVDQLEAQLATSRAAAGKLMEAVVAELTGQQVEIAA